MIIDDDIQIGNLEQEVLTNEGYSCERAYSGSEAVLLLEKTRPDLILPDLMLPGLSGEEVFKKIKGIPVIVVSANVGIEDKVSLLLDGAVDYITKPFNIRETAARVAVALRKVNPEREDVITYDEIRVDTVSHMAYVGDEPIGLTKTEYAILKLLIRNPSQVMVGKLFDRFYTVENGKNSTGLGLSIAKLLTEKMGGDIKAEYDEGIFLIEISFLNVVN